MNIHEDSQARGWYECIDLVMGLSARRNSFTSPRVDRDTKQSWRYTFRHRSLRYLVVPVHHFWACPR
jgi:hypothetical protein